MAEERPTKEGKESNAEAKRVGSEQRRRRGRVGKANPPALTNPPAPPTPAPDESLECPLPPELAQELGITVAAARRSSPYPSAAESRRQVALDADTPQTRSPAYKLGFADVDFLMRDELRGVRLQLEFLKPEIMQRDRGITGTVVIFGSARIPAPEEAEAFVKEAELAWQHSPDDPKARRRLEAARALAAKVRYYEEARRLAQLISGAENGENRDRKKYPHGPYRVVVVTGGGPGIMEAANRGAADVGAESVGLNIVLPFEQRPNRYITPYLCFNFHYFAIRKMHFMMRARALVVFPGGFGTLDELFEVLTLIQTRKIKPIPVLLFGREYWQKVINFPALVEEGVIEPEDLEIFSFVETAEEAWAILKPVLEKNAC